MKSSYIFTFKLICCLFFTSLLSAHLQSCSEKPSTKTMDKDESPPDKDKLPKKGIEKKKHQYLIFEIPLAKIEDIVVPDTSVIPKNYFRFFIDDWQVPEVAENYKFCSPSKKYPFSYPIKVMKKWDAIFPELNIKLNTVPYVFWGQDIPQSCTAINGRLKTNEGKVLGTKSIKMPMDYLGIRKVGNGYELDFYANENISEDIFNNKGSLIPGLFLIRDGSYYRKHVIFNKEEKYIKLKTAFRCMDKNGRIGIAMDKDGAAYILFISNEDKENFGATCFDTYQLLKRHIDIKDFIFFDGGGSANLSFTTGFNKPLLNGKPYEQVNMGSLRKIPHFLGMKLPISKKLDIKIFTNIKSFEGLK